MITKALPFWQLLQWRRPRIRPASGSRTALHKQEQVWIWIRRSRPVPSWGPRWTLRTIHSRSWCCLVSSCSPISTWCKVQSKQVIWKYIVMQGFYVNLVLTIISYSFNIAIYEHRSSFCGGTWDLRTPLVAHFMLHSHAFITELTWQVLRGILKYTFLAHQLTLGLRWYSWDQ